MTLKKLTLVALFSACTADPTDAPPPYNQPDAGTTVVVDDDDDNDTVPADVELTLAPVDSTTKWSSIPIHGVGPKNGTVIIETAAAGTMSASIDGSGLFCSDVPLLANTLNTITLQGVDENGSLGDVVTVEVTQTSAAEEPDVESEPAENMALGGLFPDDTTVDLDDGSSFESMVDGDYATGATLIDDWDEYDYLHLALKEMASIARIHARFASECPSEQFSVFVSDVEAPGELFTWGTSDVYLNETDWILMDEVTTATTDYELPLDAPMTFEHVAIWFESSDCGGWSGGEHKIMEIEAWTPETTATPTGDNDTAPTCANGG